MAEVFGGCASSTPDGNNAPAASTSTMTILLMSVPNPAFFAKECQGVLAPQASPTLNVTGRKGSLFQGLLRYLSSPAATRSASRFSGGASGQVAYGVNAQGGL